MNGSYVSFPDLPGPVQIINSRKKEFKFRSLIQFQTIFISILRT